MMSARPREPYNWFTPSCGGEGERNCNASAFPDKQLFEYHRAAMVAQNGPAPPHPPNEQAVNEDWSEHQLQVALANLEKLQHQLDELRTVIPQIVRSVAVPHPTPLSLHSAFKQATWGGSRSIDIFKTAWNSEQTQTIFAKARKSANENPDLAAAEETLVQLPKYGWTDMVKQEEESKPEIKVESEPSLANIPTKEDIKKMLEEYRNNHQGFQLNWDEDFKDINVSFKVQNTRLRFVIKRADTENGQPKYKAECSGMQSLSQAITRCLALRPKQEDLKYLLDMVAAYADNGKTECHRCKKLLDSKGMFVAARRSQTMKKPNGTEDTVWIGLHESCL